MPPKKQQNKQKKQPQQPKASKPTPTPQQSAQPISTTTPLAPTQSDEDTSALQRYREDKLAASYLMLHEEYLDIQDHTIDPNTVVEREDLRAIDPYAPLDIPCPSDEEEIKRRAKLTDNAADSSDNPADDGNALDMSNLMAMLAAANGGDGNEMDFSNWNPHGNANTKSKKPTIPLKTSHKQINIQMKAASEESGSNASAEEMSQRNASNPVKPRLLQLDLGLEFDLIAALDVEEKLVKPNKQP